MHKGHQERKKESKKDGTKQQKLTEWMQGATHTPQHRQFRKDLAKAFVRSDIPFSDANNMKVCDNVDRVTLNFAS